MCVTYLQSIKHCAINFKRSSYDKFFLLLAGCFFCVPHTAISQLFYKRTVITHMQTYDTVVTVNSQARHFELLRPDVFVDTLRLYTADGELLHYHIASEEVEKKMRYDSLNNIFNDTANSYSRLIFKKNTGIIQFSIATIPLTNIIYLPKNGFIIGLSKIVASPYQVVVYSTGGKLLAKLPVKNLLYNFNKKDLQLLYNNFPTIKTWLANSVVIKNANGYYVTPNWFFAKYINSSPVINDVEIVQNPNFPLMGYGTEGGIFKEYDGFYSTVAPVADLVMAGSVPYMIVLQTEDLQKLNIPLLPNCNIIEELK